MCAGGGGGGGRSERTKESSWSCQFNRRSSRTRKLPGPVLLSEVEEEIKFTLTSWGSGNNLPDHTAEICCRRRTGETENDGGRPRNKGNWFFLVACAPISFRCLGSVTPASLHSCCLAWKAVGIHNTQGTVNINSQVLTGHKVRVLYIFVPLLCAHADSKLMTATQIITLQINPSTAC